MCVGVQLCVAGVYVWLCCLEYECACGVCVCVVCVFLCSVSLSGNANVCVVYIIVCLCGIAWCMNVYGALVLDSYCYQMNYF